MTPNAPKSADQELATGSAWIDWLGGDETEKEREHDVVGNSRSSFLPMACVLVCVFLPCWIFNTP